MNRLRFLRTEKGESLEKIAKYLNVSIQTISNYEKEKRDMTPDTILKLAKYFNVSIDYLLCQSDVRNPEEIKKVPFANAGGLDTNGLDEEDLLELQRQIDYIKKMKEKNNKKEK